MAFDFDSAFQNAIQAGLAAAKPGEKALKAWVKKFSQGHQRFFETVAQSLEAGEISKESAQNLIRERRLVIDSEAAALTVISKASAQAAANAFTDSLVGALSSAFKLAL